MGSLFYNLGRKVGPKVRKVQWMWTSLTGTEADAIRLERSVGSDLADEAGRQLQIDPDLHTREILGEVGSRLSARVANPLRSFRFDAFLDGPPNAFALPGGFIFVGRPLLELCRWDKDQVAFVIAHEMAHVIRGHAIERIMANSAAAVAARARPVGPGLTAWLHKVGVRFLETAYSRDHELEADRLGVRLAAAAGYEAEAAIRVLSRLAQCNQLADPASLGQYFSTHPASDVRIASIRRYLRRSATPKGREGA